MRPQKLIAGFILFSALFMSSFAQAKDLTNRLGIGFRNSYSFDLPAVASVYYPTPDLGVVGAIGVDTEDNNSKSAFTVGLRRIIFKEENMNFFMGGNLSMLSVETEGKSDSGFEVSALAGGEFFVGGLDNLGFNFETGVAIENVDKTRFRTLADHILRAGFIFYF
ncbi:MAG: organic solvent tolerance protein [Pseudobdellovibrionaceae bacterium]|jgi:hypothetical protein